MPQPKLKIYPLRYIRPLFLGSGNCEAEFNQQFSSLHGGGVSVISLGRARAGIYVLARLALKGARHRVIMSPHTIPDVVNMVKFAGGEPVFVDCLENSTNIDLDHLAELIDETTACVFITHYHVNQNRIAGIRELCRRRGAMCFDDCAIALGADIGGRRVGTMTDASVFSLSSFKTLNFFWGGAITTNSRQLAERISRIVEAWPRLRLPQYRWQMLKTLKYDIATRPAVFSGIVFPIFRKKVLASEVEDVLPLSRIESVALDDTIMSRPPLAAFAEWNHKIDLVDSYVKHRRHIARIYDRHFGHRAVSGETSAEVRTGSAYVNYPLIIGQRARNGVYKDILSRGYDVGLSLYPNVHETPGFTGIAGRSGNVSALVRSVITLPTHPWISESYAETLAQTTAGVLAKHGLN